MAAERTLVLIKPDAMRRGLAGEILRRFEARGLELREAKLVTVDRALAEEHYAEHAAKPFFGEPEAKLGVLGEVAGKDVIELGCGSGYFGAWLARRGARVTGVDITPAQLETARRCSRELGIELELIEANAEEVPLADELFDLAISEYGASIWCDPYRWIPEAARLLRPGGELIFLCNS